MDEFGVLVESIGFKAHGKSAPMAKSKPRPKTHFAANNTEAFNDPLSLPVDELDGIFRSSLNIDKTRQSQSFVGDDDVFGGGVSSSNQFGLIDLESVLNSSSNKIYDTKRQSDSVDDLLGVFEVNSSANLENKASVIDDLIPGFGGDILTNKGGQSKTVLSPGNSSSTQKDDDFSVFESFVPQPSDDSQSFADPSEQDTKKDPILSSLDELDDFAMGRAKNESKYDGKNTTISKPSPDTTSSGFANVDDLDAIFGGGTQQKHAAPASTTTQDSQFDILFGEERTEVKQTSSATNFADNFTALFGDITTSTEEFQEIAGEPEERRRARLNRHMRTNARVAEALAEKNQRDLQSQNEQDEKDRLGETLDNDIRCWAAGKEGNLRALLSSLQQVLWPECGWRPVSLTDMITSDSVKKVYKKATLYVHPDKVQQKGATLQQKYVAEKVFDLLKEAWNKFGAEELR